VRAKKQQDLARKKKKKDRGKKSDVKGGLLLFTISDTEKKTFCWHRHTLHDMINHFGRDALIDPTWDFFFGKNKTKPYMGT
jgi:hypothetical protein